MPVIEKIPVKLNPFKVSRILRLDLDSKENRLLLDRMIDKISGMLAPRAYFRAAYISGKGSSTIRFGGISFKSRVLRKNLDAVERAFPYVVTIGPKLEKIAGTSGDLLEQFYLEALADFALGEARRGLELRIRKQYGVGKLSSMSPGSLEDWPITEQVPLFSLLGDVETRIGVRLTDSLLMVPRKSISGMLFPSETTFLSCRLCPRDRCSGRKAPFKASHRQRPNLVI